MIITRAHIEAILAAADAEMDRIPTVGMSFKPRNFTLNREQVETLREVLQSGEADTILADDQDSIRDTVDDYLFSAKFLKLNRIIAACEAALA